jgi:hypothetical protein
MCSIYIKKAGYLVFFYQTIQTAITSGKFTSRKKKTIPAAGYPLNRPKKLVTYFLKVLVGYIL